MTPGLWQSKDDRVVIERRDICDVRRRDWVLHVDGYVVDAPAIDFPTFGAALEAAADEIAAAP